MNARLVASMIVAPILLVLVGVTIFLLNDYIAYQKVEITTALLRDGKYDPSRYFTFDRACTFPPESGSAYELISRGYREVDAIVPDSFTNWTLVLIDDNKKTFRTLYVLEPRVKFDKPICNPKITLRTEMSGGQLTAYVEEARIR